MVNQASVPCKFYVFFSRIEKRGMLKNFKLSKQAQIVLLINVIQILFYQLIAAYLPISMGDKLIMFMLILISLGIATFYMTYSIDCMIKGKCNMWAWLLAGIIIFTLVYGMLATTNAIRKHGILRAMKEDETLKALSETVNDGPQRENFEEKRKWAVY